jgi:hypothetical protein
MRPENVNSKKIRQQIILFNNSHYAVAYGKTESGEFNLGMRWNGEIDTPNSIGNPQSSSHPTWLKIPSTLTIPFLKSLLNEPSANNNEILNILKTII